MAHVCPWWFAYTFDHPIRRWLLNPEGELAPHVSPGDRVLDIGCGLGFHSVVLSKLVGPEGEVVLADVQQEMLDRARARCLKQEGHATITLLLVEDGKLGIDGKFNFVLLYWMLHEVVEQERLWREIETHLAEDGKALIAEPSFHVNSQEFDGELLTIAEAGLVAEKIKGGWFNRTAVVRRLRD